MISLDYFVLGRAIAAIVRPTLTLDRTNYQEAIDKALAAYSAGAQTLIVDLGAVDSIGVAGLVALYSIARIAGGEAPLDLNAGWAAIHALSESITMRSRLVVLSPVALVPCLDRAPFNRFLEVHADLASVLAA